jgi:hypothetical protein
MNHKELNEAVALAYHFIKTAQAAFEADKKLREQAEAHNTKHGDKWTWRVPPKGEFTSPSKDIAAVKRASMDLTRALAQLRSRK